MKCAAEARDGSDEAFNRMVDEQTRCQIASIEEAINETISYGKYELRYGLHNDYSGRPYWPHADLLEVFHHFQELGYRIEWTKPVFWYRNKWITINW